MSGATPASVERLKALGWRYRDESFSECGAVSEHGDSGWCPRIAHWERHGVLRCATHARIASRYDRGAAEWERNHGRPA